jgi:hypothetical protein
MYNILTLVSVAQSLTEKNMHYILTVLSEVQSLQMYTEQTNLGTI